MFYMYQLDIQDLRWYNLSVTYCLGSCCSLVTTEGRSGALVELPAYEPWDLDISGWWDKGAGGQRFAGISPFPGKKEFPMTDGHKIVVFMPARNTAHLLRETFDDIPEGFADQIILVDNASTDNTVDVAMSLGMKVIRHENNLGYGGSLKTGYETAVKEGADIVVMLHSDNQYDPRFLPQIVEPILKGEADAVLGSRILGAEAMTGGMPWWKYIANIGLTRLINYATGSDIKEFHTGYRAYSRRVLENLPYRYNSDNFLFDTEIIVQIIRHGYRIVEIPIPTRYFNGASTMTFKQCVYYGVGILFSLSRYFTHRLNIWKSRRYSRIYEHSHSKLKP